MRRTVMVVAGILAVAGGCWATLAWWDVFVLAIKGTAGVILLLGGGMLIYMSRDEHAADALVKRVLHKEQGEES
jgi:hypothetical protein